MNIYALATPPGKSGLAVIRLSGKDALKIALKIAKKRYFKPRFATYTNLYDKKKNLIDQGLVIFFKSPKSYTGEDVVEFHIHGSYAVINHLYDTLASYSECRLAKPGEFTKNAIINGKMNLMQAEALIDLINSETNLQKKYSQKILKDDAKKLFLDLKKELHSILANYEALIDFSDEEIPINIFLRNRDKLLIINKKIQDLIEQAKNNEKIHSGYEVTVIGPVNSGKSSLINTILKRQASIVSNIPGTTRDIVRSNFFLDGKLLNISDTAGLRKTKDKVEKVGVSLSLKTLKEADLKILVLDNSKKEQETYLKYFDQNTILVINKIDLKQKLFLSSKNLDLVKISVKKNSGLKELLHLISKKLSKLYPSTIETVISRKRHLKSLKEASFYISSCLKKKDIKQLDLIAEDLRLAINSINSLVGEVNVEKLLDIIFKEYCIGK